MMISKLTSILLIFITISVSAQIDRNKEFEIIDMQVAYFEQFHISEKSLTKESVLNIYKVFLNNIDDRQIIFDKGTFQKISKANSAHPSTTKQLSEFFDAFFQQYKMLCIAKKEQIELFKNNTTNFSKKEYIKFPNEDQFNIIPLTQAQTKVRFLKELKRKTLSAMFALAMEDSVDYSISVDSILTFQDEAKQSVIERYEEWIISIEEESQDLRNSLFEEFLDAIANEFDPHSNYFSLSRKTDFENRLSKEAFLFGFAVIKGKGNTTIIGKIAPGGAAWNTNELHEGDIVVRIKEKNGEAINCETEKYRKVRKFLKDSQAEEITLTVLKEDGTRKKVDLKKQKTEVEDNVVKSFVLHGDKKIGYISLPAFYSDFSGMTSAGCANDVAKELIKLSQENVDAIILDLRYNGGGSMREAVGLAGIFIDAGPILVQKYRDAESETVKDFNRGQSYSGPLAIMVNKYSASASEIVTSALQDYNRAIVVGSSTYGKATAQSILPLDSNYITGRSKTLNDLGFTKITLSKLYGITGETHQLEGVQPDFRLPNLTDGIEKGEAQYPTALPKDTVNKKVYYTTLPEINKGGLQTASQQRILASENFKQVQEQNRQLKALIKKLKHTAPLEINEYKAIKASIEKTMENIDLATSDSTEVFQVNNNAYDADIIELYEDMLEQNNKIIDLLQQDIYLEETYQILNDLLNNK